MVPRMLIHSLACDYCRDAGLPLLPDTVPYVHVHKGFARAVAMAYENLPTVRIEDIDAWHALNSEVTRQFDLLTRAGFEFSRCDESTYPYRGSADVFDDIFRNGHLAVFFGGEPHPVMTPLETWRFRAVHDVFGHALHGWQFGPRGEENSYRTHRLMFSPLAIRALTTETRGQNSWVNFGPYSHFPVKNRPYATQKAAILPDWAQEV